jgi:hypothetical protein
VRIGRMRRKGVVVGVAVLALGTLAAVANAAGQGTRTYSPPPAGARWDYQIGEVSEYTPAPAAVSRDNAEKPWAGLYNICYINAFQSQPGDRSLTKSWLVVAGSPVEDPNWPGEYVLDTRSHRADLVKAFTPVMSTCADKGFDAVEFDNLDSYERSKGGLTMADNLSYVKDLIDVAHDRGLAVAQKNTVEFVGRAPFDFAVAESCLLYDECGEYTREYSTVLDVEYIEEMTASVFSKKCTAAVNSGSAPSFVLRDRDVSARGMRQWCSAQGTPGTPEVTSTLSVTSKTKTNTTSTTASTSTSHKSSPTHRSSARRKTSTHWPWHRPSSR